MLPRLCSGVLNLHVVASADSMRKSPFLLPRWRKRFKCGVQFMAVADKHGGKSKVSADKLGSTASHDKVSPSAANSLTFVKFDDVMTSRRKQARRSLVIQVQSEASCPELREYCEKISPVNSMFHYKLKDNHFVLVEFERNCLPEVLDRWCHISDKSTIPVAAPVVWFKAASPGTKKSGQEVVYDDNKVSHIPPRPSYETILALTEKSQRVSEMMEVLYDNTKLDELGTRLRFFTARQLELAMSGLFPHCAVLPFGSSVNGFGKSCSDLDLVFRHDYSQSDSGKPNLANRSKRLVYQSKTSLGGPRPLTQRQMEVLADVLQVMMPGCSAVKRILQARVPIVKYSYDFTGLDCDLSMTNMTGVYMSELLFLFNQLDPQSKHLICFVKTWAAACLLTNPTPGRWITNFMLIMLCVHYLQSIQRLPPLDLLVKYATAEDERITEDINCTFVRDLTRLQWTRSSSPASPSKLLRGFLDYYVNFDFGSACVSITTDARLSKPDYSPLYIVNPLERSLNVAKNVSGEELERFKKALRNASWALESRDMPANGLLTRVVQNSDSLSPLLQSSRRFVSPRMVTVKELFTDS